MPRPIEGRVAGVRSRALVGKPIADAVDGLDEPRRPSLVAQLPSQILDVAVDRSLVRVERDPVNGVEELAAGEHAARLTDERYKDLELRWRDPFGTSTGDHHLVCVEVHLELTGA